MAGSSFGLGVGDPIPPPSPYHLGVGQGQPGSTPDQFFGVSSAAALNAELNAPHISTITDFLQRKPPSSDQAIVPLALDVAASLIPSLHTLHTTMELGKHYTRRSMK